MTSSSQPETAPAPSFEFAFGGIARLYGKAQLEQFHKAHVCVIGIGGVGSWAAEALARSGIGRLTLVDLDDVCESNINRQIHASYSTIGRPKVDVMNERIRLINPHCAVRGMPAFFTESTAERILSEPYSFVLDAIDGYRQKVILIQRCLNIRMPVITMGGAGGRRDPSKIQVADLNHTHSDKLLASVRRALRKDYGFTANRRDAFGVDCVFSTEPPLFPHADGTVCGRKPERVESHRLDCASGYGAATHVTAAFAFFAVGRILDAISRKAL